MSPRDHFKLILAQFDHSDILSILLGAGPDFAVTQAYDQLGDDHVRLDTGLGKGVASAFDDASAKNVAALEALTQKLITKRISFPSSCRFYPRAIK